MYKNNLFTANEDYKDLPSMRIDSRRLIGAIFAVTLSVIVFVHANKAQAEIYSLVACDSLVDAQGEE